MNSEFMWVTGGPALVGRTSGWKWWNSLSLSVCKLLLFIYLFIYLYLGGGGGGGVKKCYLCCF